jgi:hypothetical protein
MGWVLNIVALFLFILLAIIDQVVRLFTKRSGKSAYSNGFKINVFGNELYADTFNLLLLKKGSNLFGRFGEPISSVLGRAYIGNHLNWLGHVVRFLVDAADVPMWLKGKSHCVEWIRTQEGINEYKETL